LEVNAKKGTSFRDSLKSLYSNYAFALRKCGLSLDTQVFSRYYLSDISNQETELGKSPIFKCSRSGAYSVIQQCPLEAGALTLFTYHIKNKRSRLKKEIIKFDEGHWRNCVKVKGENYSLLWTGNFSGYGLLDSYEQTNEIFSVFNTLVNDNGMTLFNNTIRTWIYVRDIDNNYQGMAESRKTYFEQQGLVKETRYIASTGIEAKLKETGSLVSLDSLSISNLKKEQIIRMEAPDNLCPTYDYGITFERGTMVEFGERAHLYISGTASIDKNGNVLFPFEIKKQTKRALDNISALLKRYGATLDDLAYLVVYIRNITEAGKVKDVLRRFVRKGIPVIMVEGAVCRPSWLVEIEGLGIISKKTAFPEFV